MFKLRIYAKLFEIELFWPVTMYKEKTVILLNWIVWNFYQNDFGIKWPRKYL